MGLFKRANWHSGLTYRNTCPDCKTIVTYMDDKLDFRPWYADGFVYCPTCQRPLRHNEGLAIEGTHVAKEVDLTPKGTKTCANCSRVLEPTDNFCPRCGTKVN